MMTEREFRLRISSLAKAGSYLDDAVQAAREAGLKFAPEPVRLPEKLEARRDGKVGWTEGWPWVAWEPAEQNSAPADPRQISDTALLRYNAYPGLRAAASRLLEAVGAVLPHAGVETCLRQAYRALEAELAKGLK